jgi:hypothetical protein
VKNLERAKRHLVFLPPDEPVIRVVLQDATMVDAYDAYAIAHTRQARRAGRLPPALRDEIVMHLISHEVAVRCAALRSDLNALRTILHIPTQRQRCPHATSVTRWRRQR